jgi:membrane protein YqaA with SNARE-associated domain
LPGGDGLDEAQDVLAGLGVEAVIHHGVGGVERGRGLDRWVTDADFAIIPDAQLAPYLQRDSGKGLMRTHLCLQYYVPAAAGETVCAFARRAKEFGGFGWRRVDARAMKHLTGILFGLFAKFGGFGLLVLGILDSSFLFAPLGNDVLVVALTARQRNLPLMLYYAGMSTVGSVFGCLLVDVVFRKAGEKGLEKHLSRKRLEYVRRKVTDNAAWALVIASIAPPPFPFTPFVMAAAALQYPRRRLLAITGAARMVRFTALGVLAYFYGRRILKWAESDVVQWILIGVVVICAIGSVVSVVGWIRRSRRVEGGSRRQSRPGRESASPELG